MIHLSNITKQHGSQVLFRDAGFQILPWTRTGLVGPNGAGKTTTMRILSGYMPPTMGVARVAGFDVVDQSLEVRKRVGYFRGEP